MVQTPPLSPGDQILILGEGFGGSEDGPPTPPVGSLVRLNGYFPGGHLTLEVLRWAPVYILARVAPISGYPDQGIVTIQVMCGQFGSNQVDSSFEATREVRAVRREDYQVLVCHDADLEENFCNLNFPNTGGFEGHHNYTDGECGHDQVRVVLGHHFVLQGAYLAANPAHLTSQEPPAVSASFSGLQPGAARSGIRIDWCYDGLGGIDYLFSVYAVGPAGLDYK